MANDMMVKELDQVVVRFSGDSGDGMQLAGNIFSTVSATVGNDISTFPDYPADIRAPQGSLTGVSGFQVHIGASKVFTPGDKCDVLVAMNAAALKTQYSFFANFSLRKSSAIFRSRLNNQHTKPRANMLRHFSIGHNTHASVAHTYKIESKIKTPGIYMDIMGNKATGSCNTSVAGVMG